MHRYLLSITAALGLLLAASSTAHGQAAVFGFNDNNGAASSGTYMPGDSFTFSITLGFAPGGPVANVDGLSYWFEQSNPSAPFYFSITNRDNTGSPFTDLQSPHIVYPQNLTPANASDLGALAPAAGFGAGVYFVANLTIHIDPSATAGVYQIENTTTGGKTSLVVDDQGHTFPIAQDVYTITIVPEPSSLALCATGLPIAFGFLRRFRAGRNR